MFTPICIDCGRQMLCHKNEAIALHLNPDGEPIGLWFCDLYKCPDCSRLIATGFGREAIAEMIDNDFEQRLEELKDRIDYKFK